MKHWLVIILLLAIGVPDSLSQQVVTFTIKKVQPDPLDAVLPCHNNLFFHGNLVDSVPNLKGFGRHYSWVRYAWVDFKTSTFYVARDSSENVVTENHANGHLYFLETREDLYDYKFDLSEFMVDTNNGIWLGAREDTVGKKEVYRLIARLEDCSISIEKQKGYYKKIYFTKELSENWFWKKMGGKWTFHFKEPIINWIEVGAPKYEYFDRKLPKFVLNDYKPQDL